MNKLKMFKNKTLLASLILMTTLSGCKTANNDYESVPTTRHEIITRDLDEEVEEKETIIPQEEIEEYKQDIYSLDNTYINISYDNKVNISDYQDSKMIKSISLNELITTYGYILDYDANDNTITKENLKLVVYDIRSRLEEIKYSHPTTNKINLDSITLFSAIDLNNGTLTSKLIMQDYDYKEWYDSLVDENQKQKYLSELQSYEIAKYNFLKDYSNFVISEDDSKYISIIDYVLLNGSISYSRNLEEMFNKLPIYTDEEVYSYKKGILKKYNINIDDNSLRFNPNDIDEVDSIINNLSLDLDTSDIVLNYIAINNEVLDDNTILSLASKYLASKYPAYMNNSELEIVNNIKYLASINYKVSLNQESLAAQNSIYSVLKTYTDHFKEADNIELEHATISKDNHKKACQELCLLQKVYSSLFTPSSIKDTIINSLVKVYLNIELKELHDINIPNSIFEPNERDYTWIYLMLVDDYMDLDEDNLYSNFEIANNRLNSIVPKQKIN